MATVPLDPTAPPELLPCPGCGTVSHAPVVSAGVDTVTCERCGKLLRHRPALTAVERAQADILRAAARGLENACTTRPKRGKRSGYESSRQVFDDGLRRAAELLREWSRLIHKRRAAR